MKIKIYSGLSLGPAHVARILPQAEFARPIKRRDVWLDIKQGYHVLGIVDGEFLQNLAVSPSEIADAMRCGIKVYGSSSMGAMRAAELREYGMIGVGRIFEHIRDADYFKDDHLGQLFADGAGSKFSLPFLDLKLGIEDLSEKGKVGKEDAAVVIRLYEQLHFSERSFSALRASLRKADRDDLAKLLAGLERQISSAKQRDGLLLLNKIKQDLQLTARINQRIDAGASPL